MSKYPTENSLTINTTHQMLDHIKSGFKKASATSPTRREEKGVGYDVQLSFALRIQFQYKRPQNIHNRRGVTFDINGEQVGTLCFRDDTQTPYLACPSVEHRGELNNSLENCHFVNANAVSKETSLLYVPKDYDSNPSSRVTAKIKNGEHYQVADWGVKTWSEVVKGIRNRNLGLPVRRGGKITSRYKSFVDRLMDLRNLYFGSSLRTDGGEEPSDKKELNEEIAAELVHHAVENYREFYENQEKMPDPEVETETLWQVIDEMEDTKDPSMYKIRRSQELVFEDGSAASPLELGHRQ